MFWIPAHKTAGMTYLCVACVRLSNYNPLQAPDKRLLKGRLGPDTICIYCLSWYNNVVMKEQIQLGTWREEGLSLLLKEASGIDEPGERIDFLSKHFLDTPYKDLTLIGDKHTAEVLVINIEEVDCFTFIEYIEAMRRSKSFNEFREHLIKVRYRSGHIAFEHRNHFFTDWKVFHSGFVVDVTEDIGSGRSRKVNKRLNQKQDGTVFLPGISCRQREVTYLQSVSLDESVMEKLNTGDYIGIYSGDDGLDVSHVGILIKNKHSLRLRHASSLKKYRKVVDEDFKEYLEGKPGMIVLRPKDSSPSP
ncbi:MAG TPA: DUF1460 domain-containing protein [Nitrospiraceae bacterium]|nr:DUF1460 domain-containing protein [Nitrospiraceae bacterium]